MANLHSKIEKNVFILLSLALITTMIGGMVEILPLFKKEIAMERVEGMRPHTPLELAGFNIYKREGCYNCHSQQIRYLRDEVERYGHYSLAAESMYDYPFIWGSKRTGPDLARVGGRYSDDWHVTHLIDPRSLVPESIMPSYPFLHTTKLDYSKIADEMKTMKMIGVPYTDQDIKDYENDIKIQTGIITEDKQITDFQSRYNKAAVRKFDKEAENITELDALVAYLQAIGNKVDLKTNQGRNW
ncbi:cytochrome c oxidase, cbb3-type subunit II [endosymbiont of Acanthamoeba sp. UWC8]|uniref:cytochrome-c oxidase, cbb3-type subunit II n=1 Tax=endosymbiont of Acanthamoeba sp. UWC8 TaxID=86106 RepID=UPI0004D0C2EF|nr:cytochrome-c oxidase, cbb3-type subunit II [endosymbiont of Acanthamoeba sp. UWC8]AIF81774.1 cytochrome c oxidase, cbb3-type subunit II [endosymbiont of Acanthamoeba sp. UWC8]